MLHIPWERTVGEGSREMEKGESSDFVGWQYVVQDALGTGGWEGWQYVVQDALGTGGWEGWQYVLGIGSSDVSLAPLTLASLVCGTWHDGSGTTPVIICRGTVIAGLSMRV